jgi:hypothetical protein
MWPCNVKQYGQFTGGNLIPVPTKENALFELYPRIRSLQIFALRVYPVSSSRNAAIEWRLSRRSRELVPTGKERKHN